MGESERAGRWTGTWLPGASSGSDRVQRYRGERLGLPPTGPGSVASMGRKLGALLVDLVLAGLIAMLFVRAPWQDTAAMTEQNYWGVLIWYLLTVAGHGFFGVTPGMAVLGMRVARTDGAARVGVPRALPRTLCVAVLVPAVIWDADNRGLHDRLVGTLVVNTR